MAREARLEVMAFDEAQVRYWVLPNTESQAAQAVDLSQCACVCNREAHRASSYKVHKVARAQIGVEKGMTSSRGPFIYAPCVRKQASILGSKMPTLQESCWKGVLDVPHHLLNVWTQVIW